jgi:hypothetical protein
MFTATTKYMENTGPEMIFFRIKKNAIGKNQIPLNKTSIWCG